MPIWVNIVGQLAGVATQIFAVPALIPDEHVRAWVHALASFLQAAVGLVAHQYNPDGSRAVKGEK